MNPAATDFPENRPPALFLGGIPENEIQRSTDRNSGNHVQQQKGQYDLPVEIEFLYFPATRPSSFSSASHSAYYIAGYSIDSDWFINLSIWTMLFLSVKGKDAHDYIETVLYLR